MSFAQLKVQLSMMPIYLVAHGEMFAKSISAFTAKDLALDSVRNIATTPNGISGILAKAKIPRAELRMILIIIEIFS